MLSSFSFSGIDLLSSSDESSPNKRSLVVAIFKRGSSSSLELDEAMILDNEPSTAGGDTKNNNNADAAVLGKFYY